MYTAGVQVTESRMSMPDRNAARAMPPAIIAAACLLTVCIAVNAVAGLASATPRVGDIVAFIPSPIEPMDGDIRLLVRRLDQFGCVLDLGVLRQSGGSLVVETKIGGNDAGGFGVHWAGPRTSADSSNCGSDADLIVDHRDLDILAVAADGYGMGFKPATILTAYGGG